MQVKKFTFNPFQENTYVVFDETKEAVIIDPGCYESHEEQELFDFIEQNDDLSIYVPQLEDIIVTRVLKQVC